MPISLRDCAFIAEIAPTAELGRQRLEIFQALSDDDVNGFLQGVTEL